MKLLTLSALLMPLAVAGVALAGPVARAAENDKRQTQGQLFQITVGSAHGDLKYFPSSIPEANVGDIVIFTLADGASTHTITQAVDGNEPCTAAPNGLDHTFDPSDSSSLSLNVTVTFPGPFHAFCSIPSHCEGGMKFTVNV